MLVLLEGKSEPVVCWPAISPSTGLTWCFVLRLAGSQ